MESFCCFFVCSFVVKAEKRPVTSRLQLGLGEFKQHRSVDYSDITGSENSVNSQLFGGADPFKDGQTNNKLLKWTWQWRMEAKTGDMASRPPGPIKRPTAAFWTNSRRDQAIWLKST